VSFVANIFFGSKNKKNKDENRNYKTEGFKLTALNPLNKKYLKIVNKLLYKKRLIALSAKTLCKNKTK
jgi:hypothetical protein